MLTTGTATWDEGLLLFLERSGYPEETYHTFSYSPLRDDAGTIAGMLCVVTEETERGIGERRLATLGALASELASAQTEQDWRQRSSVASAGTAATCRSPRSTCSTRMACRRAGSPRPASPPATPPCRT